VHSFDLIATLAGGLTAALLFGYVTQRLNLSPIVGYLCAGIVIGPHSPGFVADLGMAEQLAELGVILLMFGVGLQFHLKELLDVRGVAVPGAVAQSVVATGLGALLARAFGWDWTGSLVFGIALSVASTVVLIRVLSDNHDLHTPTGHIAVGWLVVEDLFTVIVLVLLPALATGGSSVGGVFWTLAVTTLKVSVLLAIIVVIGNRAVPKLLDLVASTRSRELFTLTVLVLALGVAVGSAELFGVSMALGAFLAGMVVGQSEYSLRAASEAMPMRDAFSVLFFVSVGMLLDPMAMMENGWLIAGTLGVVLIGKPLVAAVVVVLLRYPFVVAMAVAAALAQIGEFSFILATLGTSLGVLPPVATNVIVAVAIISIVLNPLLYRAVGPLQRLAAKRPRVWHLLNGLTPLEDASPALRSARDPKGIHRAVVVGFGPTGRTLMRLLQQNGIEPSIIELNMDTVRELRDGGVAAVYGDASHRTTLEEAGLASARHLILTADVGNSQEVIREARDINREIHVVARTNHLRGLAALRIAGAQSVFSGEGEVALAMTEAILQRLGATAEQIDRERGRVHSELLG
jgi:CPA2 family monovalent cation:H+ antiporter-2